MKNVRKYGSPPYQAVFLHGGPGGAGEMAPVAKELSSSFGILEPLQTKNTIDSQVSELKEIIEENTDSPITLVGYSWGAWLGFIFTAKNHSLVKKLILVSSGPFMAKDAKTIMLTRLERLSDDEKKELDSLMKRFGKLRGEEKDKVFKRVGKIISKADSYKSLPHEEISVQADIYESVWPEAAKLRESGNLLSLAKQIKVPVIAFHGDYDPHPAAGVKTPLSASLDNFKFILIKNCGHTPWYERKAKEKFYRAIKREL